MKILHKILRAFARTFFFLLAKIAELLHALSTFALARLGDAVDDPETAEKVEGMSVRQIASALGVSRRRANEIQKKSRDLLSPLPRKTEYTKNSVFRVRRLGDTMGQ